MCRHHAALARPTDPRGPKFLAQVSGQPTPRSRPPRPRSRLRSYVRSSKQAPDRRASPPPAIERRAGHWELGRWGSAGHTYVKAAPRALCGVRALGSVPGWQPRVAPTGGVVGGSPGGGRQVAHGVRCHNSLRLVLVAQNGKDAVYAGVFGP